MIITLIKPLSFFYKIKPIKINQNYFNVDNLKVEIPVDKRFKILNYRKELIKLTHSQQIKLMIINNAVHKLYLSNKLKYYDIIEYIMCEIRNNNINLQLNSFNSILNFISLINKKYQTNV